VILVGVYWAGCLLLVAAGAAKARRPADTARAVATVVPRLGPAAARRGVRALAGAEAVLGVVAIVYAGLGPAVLVAASYFGFALFVVLARRHGGPLATCGCFGTPDTAPTRLHVVLDVGFAAAASLVAVRAPGGTIGAVLAAQPLGGVPLLAMSAVLAYVAGVALTGLGRLHTARRSLQGP
jgi:hypothetical protein